MPDILVLLPKHYSREDTLLLLDREGVRAAAFGDFGSGFGGLAFVRTASLSSAADTGRVICPDESLEDCISGLLIPLPVVPSTHSPGDYNMFAAVTLDGGRQLAYQRHLLGAGEAPEGVRDARALVLGMDGVHALVEVVGDDLAAVTARLFELVTHDDVLDIRTFVCGAESTAGFGGQTLAQVRKASKKGTATRRSRG